MTVSVVSLLGANVDEAAIDLAAYLTGEGIEAGFREAPHARRLELVTDGGADVVWLCGGLAVDIDRSVYELVAAPCFTGEAGASYRSVVISRDPSADLVELCSENTVWVMNEPLSWSGHRAIVAECDLRGLTLPDQIVWSGSHLGSIRMVADGAADAAVIDSTLWRWANVTEPRAVDVTRPWPAPPILVRRDVLSRIPSLPAVLAAATGLRGVDRLESADRRHLDPLRRRMAS